MADALLAAEREAPEEIHAWPRRDFTWAEHGEALMRRRKPWYYQREPCPGVTVISNRLVDLACGGPR